MGRVRGVAGSGISAGGFGACVIGCVSVNVVVASRAGSVVDPSAWLEDGGNEVAGTGVLVACPFAEPLDLGFETDSFSRRTGSTPRTSSSTSSLGEFEAGILAEILSSCTSVLGKFDAVSLTAPF